MPGVKLTSHIGRSFVRNEKHEFSSLLGILGRYQSSSLLDAPSIFYPIGTSLPFPVMVFRHQSNMRTYAAGIDLQVRYNYNITEKMSIGILGGIQIDTQGDLIRQTSFSVGYLF